MKPMREVAGSFFGPPRETRVERGLNSTERKTSEAYAMLTGAPVSRYESKVRVASMPGNSLEHFPTGSTDRNPYAMSQEEVNIAIASIAKSSTHAVEGNSDVRLSEGYVSKKHKAFGHQSANDRLNQRVKINEALGKAIDNRRLGEGVRLPKFGVLEGHYVEERLPIIADRNKVIALYKKNRRRFDRAVESMVKLGIDWHLEDLVVGEGTKNDFAINITGIDIRFDNAPIIINPDGTIQIALIDTDQFEQRGPGDDRNSLKVIVALFPDHMEKIIKYARQNGLKVDRKALKAEQIKSRDYRKYQMLVQKWIAVRPSVLIDFNAGKHNDQDLKETMEGAMKRKFYNPLLQLTDTQRTELAAVPRSNLASFLSAIGSGPMPANTRLLSPKQKALFDQIQITEIPGQSPIEQRTIVVNQPELTRGGKKHLDALKREGKIGMYKYIPADDKLVIFL